MQLRLILSLLVLWPTGLSATIWHRISKVQTCGQCKLGSCMERNKLFGQLQHQIWQSGLRGARPRLVASACTCSNYYRLVCSWSPDQHAEWERATDAGEEWSSCTVGSPSCRVSNLHLACSACRQPCPNLIAAATVTGNPSSIRKKHTQAWRWHLWASLGERTIFNYFPGECSSMGW